MSPGLTTFLVLKNIRVNQNRANQNHANQNRANQNCANQITFIKYFKDSVNQITLI